MWKTIHQCTRRIRHSLGLLSCCACAACNGHWVSLSHVQTVLLSWINQDKPDTFLYASIAALCCEIRSQWSPWIESWMLGWQIPKILVLLDVARNFAEVVLLVMIADMFNGVYISHGYILTSVFIYVLYHIYFYIYIYIYFYIYI